MCYHSRGKGRLLDDVLQDAGWAVVFVGWICETRCRRVRDNQVGVAYGRRVQDPGVVPEDARRSANDAMGKVFLANPPLTVKSAI